MAPDTANLPIITGRPLYKYDSKGKLRIWFMEQQGNKHRTVAGLEAGKRTTSAWTTCKGKQKRTDEEQAAFEINADYTYGLKRDYFETPEEATGGARYFEPQLAEKWSDTTWDKWMAQLKKAGITPKPGTTGVFFQSKLDGFCCIAQKSGLTTREGELIVSVPHINKALEPFFEQYPDAVLHGELYNHALRDDFQKLSSILRKQVNITEEEYALAREMAQYHVYDYASPEVRDLGFDDRSEQLLVDLGPYCADDKIIQYVVTVPVRDEKHMIELFYAAIEDGYEGGIGRLVGPYVKKRCWWVIKIKILDSEEFEVAEIVEGVGNYAGYAKRATLWLPGADRSEGITKTNSFGAGIKGGQSQFNRDLLGEAGKEQKVATVDFFGRYNTGIPRQGIVTKWHGAKRVL